MKKIIISIDHKWRDLAGYVYITMLLEKCGYKVYLIRHGFEEIYASKIQPDMIIMIHLYAKENQKLAQKFKDANIKVVLMPTEGIPTLEKYRSFAAGSENDLSGVALQCVWNYPMYNALTGNATIDKEKIKVTGVPRFDFYKEPLTKALLPKEQFKRKYRIRNNFPILTVATNFTQAQFYHKNKEFLEQDAAKLGFGKVLNIKENAMQDFNSRELMLNAVSKIVVDQPEINIIMKLHPSEDHEYYFQYFKKYLMKYQDRVKIIVQDYIWDILNSTDIEIKRSCTTGIESWILGKPTIEFQLNPDEWYYSQEHASGSIVVRSYDELINTINNYLVNPQVEKSIRGKREEFLSKWCYKVDGQSSKRFIEEIKVTLGMKKKKTKFPKKIKFLLYYYMLEMSGYFLHDIRQYGLINTLRGKKIDKLGRVDKFFHKSDVRYWKKRIKTVTI